MPFVLRYEKSVRGAQDPKPNFVRWVLEAAGHAFYIEKELVVFHESFEAGSRPVYAATLSDLHYIECLDGNDKGAGYKVTGKFPGGDDIEIWAAEAQTFYCEQGFAVFYERPDRTGKQALAVRCSDVVEIRWLPQKDSSQ
jgi:hypothetical protein